MFLFTPTQDIEHKMCVAAASSIANKFNVFTLKYDSYKHIDCTTLELYEIMLRHNYKINMPLKCPLSNEYYYIKSTGNRYVTITCPSHLKHSFSLEARNN